MKYISQGPMLLDVHMHRPHTTTRNFMDALLAFWPGLQVSGVAGGGAGRGGRELGARRWERPGRFGGVSWRQAGEILFIFFIYTNS